MEMNTQNLKPIKRGEARNPRGSSKKAREKAALKKEAGKIVGSLFYDYIQNSNTESVLFWERFLVLAPQDRIEAAYQDTTLPYSVRLTIEAIERDRQEGRTYTLNEIKKRLLGNRVLADITLSATANTPPPTYSTSEYVEYKKQELIREEREAKQGGLDINAQMRHLAGLDTEPLTAWDVLPEEDPDSLYKDSADRLDVVEREAALRFKCQTDSEKIEYLLQENRKLATDLREAQEKLDTLELGYGDSLNARLLELEHLQEAEEAQSTPPTTTKKRSGKKRAKN